jgi:hypothetical protein
MERLTGITIVAAMNITATRSSAVPASALLHSWYAYQWRNGVHVDQLAAFDRVTALTQHSTYELIVTAPASAEVLVRGGTFFPAFTRARLAGCTMGGSFLKLRSIHVGFHIEFAIDDGVIVTSPVRTILTMAAASLALPSSAVM